MKKEEEAEQGMLAPFGLSPLSQTRVLCYKTTPRDFRPTRTPLEKRAWEKTRTAEGAKQLKRSVVKAPRENKRNMRGSGLRSRSRGCPRK